MADAAFSKLFAAAGPAFLLFAVPAGAATAGEISNVPPCHAAGRSVEAASGAFAGARITRVAGAGLALADGSEARLGDIRFADRLPDMTAADRRRIKASLQDELTAVLADRPLVACALSRGSVAPARDRYGRRVVDAIDLEKPFSLRRHLVARGLALVLPDPVFPGGSADPATDLCCAALYRAEAQARTGKKGVWATATPLIRKVDSKNGAVGLPRSAFSIVEGWVRSVGDRERELFLNFGYRWTTDFTATVPKRSFSGDAAALDRLTRLTGSRIRVRGIADPWQGGRIPVTSPDQIEILTPMVRPPAVAE